MACFLEELDTVTVSVWTKFSASYITLTIREHEGQVAWFSEGFSSTFVRKKTSASRKSAKVGRWINAIRMKKCNKVE